MKLFNYANLKTLLRYMLLLPAGMMLMYCGGGGTLSQADVAQMSPQEKILRLEKQAQKKPTDISIKRMLYQEYLAADMNPRALSVMEDILVIDPNQIDVQFQYGELQYKSGNAQRAYEAFLRVMESTQGDIYRSSVSAYIAGGYKVIQLTNNPAAEGFPVFSPDGKKIMYQKKVGNNWDIFEYDLATRGESTVITSPADEELPDYSPDGSAVIYASNADDRRPVDAKFKVREISLLNKADNFVQTLTQSAADDWLPRYSNDGEKVLFVSERGDLRDVSYVEKQSDLYLMEKDGDFQLQLTKTAANEGGPCFSADDKRVFYHSDQNGQFDIFTIRPDGSQMMTVVDEKSGNDVNPDASKDGEWITFMSDRDGNYEIYRARINGADQERLSFSPGVDGNPAFSPDGRSIVFHSNRYGNYDIFLVDLNQKTQTMSTAQLINRLTEMTGN